MWYIWNPMTTSGYMVAQTQRAVGDWAQIVDGPFASCQEANAAMEARWPCPFNTPYTPAPRHPAISRRQEK